MSEKQPLHPATEYLVVRGMAAVRDKLARAEQKYGYRDGWLSPNWMSECRAKMYHHITKGDPLDVIAYCLFLWHHGAPTCRPGFHVELLDQFDVVLDRRDLRDFARSAIEHALREPQYDGAGVTSTWYLEESMRRADEFVEKFSNRIQPIDEVAPAAPSMSTTSDRESTIAEILCKLDGMIKKGDLDEPSHSERNGMIMAYNAVARLNVDPPGKCMCSGLGPCEKRNDGSCRLVQQGASQQSDPVGEWGELREFVERENAAAREGGEHADR